MKDSLQDGSGRCCFDVSTADIENVLLHEDGCQSSSVFCGSAQGLPTQSCRRGAWLAGSALAAPRWVCATSSPMYSAADISCRTPGCTVRCCPRWLRSMRPWHLMRSAGSSSGRTRSGGRRPGIVRPRHPDQGADLRGRSWPGGRRHRGGRRGRLRRSNLRRGPLPSKISITY
jgi:hypothetical protein